MTTTPMARPPAARPAPRPQAGTAAPSAREFALSRGKISGAQRVLLYGPGGIGKSTLAALAPDPVFLDLEAGTRELDVQRFELDSFNDLRACLQSNQLNSFKTINIDTSTKAEELSVAYTLDHVKHEKGHSVNSIEGYGFGKGLQHVFDTFLLLLSDCDRHVREGRNVILIAHSCIDTVPNPHGDDWIRHEPHLQAPKSGKASIRNRVVQWADHALFLGYDVIAKDGKGKGSGTRTIWSQEMPTHVAKSRTVEESIPCEKGSNEIWTRIFGGEA